MKTTNIMIATMLVVIYSSGAFAATVCVRNKETGLFENKTASNGNRKNGPNECDIQTLRDAIDVAPSKPSSIVKETPSEMMLPSVEVVKLPPEPPKKEWKITLADTSVRGLLERWSKEDNYQLLWEISVDLQLGASATISGSFLDALNSVLASLSSSEYPVEAMIYDNRVVRVVKQTPRRK